VEILRKNLAPQPNTHILDGAIGSTPGFVSMDSGASSVGGQTERASQGIKVYTIDDAVTQIDNGALFIAKIDIEGFEDDLFSTNIGWIDRAAAVMIEPHDWMLPGRRSSHSFQAALGGKGYDIFIQDGNLLYIRP
jgi:hypothetical protein